jgi:F-type H+-transporting ATPase subunit delta
MSGIKSAIRYAKAVVNFAKEQGKSEAVYEDMLLVASTLSENKELQIMLNSPVIKSELKRNVLIEVFGKTTTNITAGLIDLLIRNKRLLIFGEIAKQYTILYDYLRGKETAMVTSAIPLTKEMDEKILTKVKEITGKEVTIENVVNSDIIGGFILRIGDIQYDASIAHKLQVLKRQFDHESYISKL